VTSTLQPTHLDPEATTSYRPDGHPAPPSPAGSTRRAAWPLFGVAGAVSGFLAAMLAFPPLEEEDYTKGPEVIDQLSAGSYRVAFLCGMVAVGCLFVAAAGWRRWAEARAPRDLAARVVGQGIAATATVNIVFYGITGAMGLYLDGGVEDVTGMNDQGLYVFHALLDFGSLLGWWGVTMSAIAVAVLAFRRANLLPRWMGVASVVLLLLPLGMAVGTSLPGLVGFFMPIWLLVVSIGMAVSRKAAASA